MIVILNVATFQQLLLKKISFVLYDKIVVTCGLGLFAEEYKLIKSFCMDDTLVTCTSRKYQLSVKFKVS